MFWNSSAASPLLFMGECWVPLQLTTPSINIKSSCLTGSIWSGSVLCVMTQLVNKNWVEYFEVFRHGVKLNLAPPGLLTVESDVPVCVVFSGRCVYSSNEGRRRTTRTSTARTPWASLYNRPMQISSHCTSAFTHSSAGFCSPTLTTFCSSAASGCVWRGWTRRCGSRRDRLDNQVNTRPAAPLSSSIRNAFRSLSVSLSQSVRRAGSV